MFKNESLTTWLTDHDGTAFSIAFVALEGVLDSELPSAARQRREWWSNDVTKAPHATAWGAAGWQVASVDIAAQKVRFEKKAAGRTAKAA